MLKLLKDTKIAQRIAIALAVPIVGMLAVSGSYVAEKHAQVGALERLQVLANLAPIASGLVHEMQKERGMSAGFIASEGARFAAELNEQRKATDSAFSNFSNSVASFPRNDYGPKLSDPLQDAEQALVALADSRAAVDQFGLTVPQMAKYYTSTIAKLLAIVEAMSSLSEDAAVTNMIGGYTAFLQLKERAGQERAIGAGGFAAGEFEPAAYRKFLQIIARQESLRGVFLKHATDEQRTFLASTLTGAAVDEVDRMRGIAIQSLETGNTGGVEGPAWFGEITKKINLMKAVEDRIAGDLDSLTTAAIDEAQSAFTVILAIISLLAVVTIVIGVSIARGITRPLYSITDVVTRLAGGNKDVSISHQERGDELGEIARAIGVFRDNLQEADRLRLEREEKDARAEEEKRAAMMELADRFESSVQVVVGGFAGATDQLRSSTEAVSKLAGETQSQAGTVVSASQQATDNVSTVASATEELSASIEEIRRQVAESSRMATEAEGETTRTNEQVRSLVDAASNIGDVINLISDIAEQTNLLALNATIEAARAGEAGKGFAVVASEVKSLATQTAKATEEISQQIASIQSATDDAAKAIQGVGKTVTNINEIGVAIAGAVDEQNVATKEIAENVQEAAAGTQRVSGAIDSVGTAATESGRAAEEMITATDELSQQAQVLSDEVDKFLNHLRAA